MSDIFNIKNNDINSISAMDVINNMQKTDGTLKTSTTVEVNGHRYEFSVRRDETNGKLYGTTKALDDKGFFAALKRFFCGVNAEERAQRMNVANAITQKIASIISDNKYAQLTNNLLQFRAIVNRNLTANNKNIEIADYGLSPNRNLVKNNNLLDKIRNEYADKGVTISFNQIDSYNSAGKITPATLCILPKPDAAGMEGNYEDTMNAIMNGSIIENYDKYQGIPKEKTEDWVKFLQRPENMKKINIPAKLNEYLHQPADSVVEKQTGWKAEFKADPDKALKNFVIKNLSHDFKDITPEELSVLVKDVKRYLDIMNIPDRTERDRKLEEFFDINNGWRNKKEQEKYEQEVKTLKEEYPDSSEEEIISFALSSNHVGTTRRFLMLNNVFVYATFRQTSKLGLEFFQEQNKPVMFQFADYNGNSLEGRFGDIKNEIKNRKDENGNITINQGKLGSAITHSEMRHAARMQKRLLDAQFDLNLVYGGNKIAK